MVATRRLAATALALCLAAPAAAQQAYVYPSRGQSPQQQQKDEGECMTWAKGQTGFDPLAAPPTAQASAPPPQGQRVRGAARGAALGAVGGAIAGDAGQGAAAGAAMGGMVGGMRRRDARRQQAAVQDQNMAQYNARRGEYNRAYGACLSGRGYTVQ